MIEQDAVPVRPGVVGAVGQGGIPGHGGVPDGQQVRQGPAGREQRAVLRIHVVEMGGVAGRGAAPSLRIELDEVGRGGAAELPPPPLGQAEPEAPAAGERLGLKVELQDRIEPRGRGVQPIVRDADLVGVLQIPVPERPLEPEGGVVDEDLMPILCSSLPGRQFSLRSTTNAENFSFSPSTRANTT